MSTTTGNTDRHHITDPPDFPGARSPRCPFDPPTQQADWRRARGLREVRLTNGRTAWAVTRYDDVKKILSDPRISADGRRYPQLMNSDRTEQPQAFPRMDDPEHARIRLTLTGEFTVKRVETMRPHVRSVVDRFLSELVEAGQPADLVHHFAQPIPSTVISLLLGVPYGDRAFFQTRSATLQFTGASPEDKKTAHRELFQYLVGLVERKETEPGDDLISRLMKERVATGEFTAREVAMNSLVILHAGHDTTANLIALGTLALLRNPQQADRIRETDDPRVVARAVEELLRYLSISQDLVFRVATEDLVIGGQLVREGQMLTVSVPSANRDTVFEAADTLDVGRDTRGHLAFGYGVHQCLGQSLARVELQEALPALLRRLPDLRLAVPLQDVRFRHDTATYGVYVLPVAW
ncbi:cytochrome P450 [Streptomyces shenzhenensis]|uniref:Cytochrome P450 n=1 Tax=Streptomyces shenzhenensis TaxID=943815 RepID=A0A3M0HQN6_9ACTN|nr:cytochrome P450 [Streptomyces shenzhenensis]RMB79751.1 cytochrome P450 [Streptomyces shenzhenensis]